MQETIILGVKIQYDENNIRIIDSYKVKLEADMVIILKIFKIKENYKSKRTVTSWIREWKAHNRLYNLGLFKEHTRDCDLEENEKWYRLLAYQILGF